MCVLHVAFGIKKTKKQEGPCPPASIPHKIELEHPKNLLLFPSSKWLGMARTAIPHTSHNMHHHTLLINTRLHYYFTPSPS